MAVFSTNQNRQVYVAKAYKALGESDTVASKLTTVGDVTVVKDKDGYINIHQLGFGGLVKSEAINPASITYAKASAPADTELKLKKVTLTLDSSVNNGKPIAGEDYILRVNFRQLYGMSNEDIYQKYGAVHAVSVMNTTTDLFWLTMAESLVKNFKRCYAPLLDIALVTAQTNGVSTASTVINDIKKVGSTWYVNGSAVVPGTAYKGIDVIEKSQVNDWALGTAQLTPVYFEVIPTTVMDDGVESVWGVVSEPKVAGTIGNGYNTADLEYFCMGERGDQYRLAMWPKNIKTKYMVNENKTYFYLDIHHYYAGNGDAVQKSEQDIVIVSESVSVIASIVAAMGIHVKDTAAFKTANTADTTDNGLVD